MKKYSYVGVFEDGSTCHATAHCWNDADRMIENMAEQMEKALVSVVRVDVQAAFKQADKDE